MAKICTPAAVYFLFSFVTIVFNFLTSFHFLIFIVNLFFTILWSWGLNFLCNTGFEIVSWILVVFPFFIYFYYRM